MSALGSTLGISDYRALNRFLYGQHRKSSSSTAEWISALALPHALPPPYPQVGGWPVRPVYFFEGAITALGDGPVEGSLARRWREIERGMMTGLLLAEIYEFFELECWCEAVRYWIATRPAPLPLTFQTVEDYESVHESDYVVLFHSRVGFSSLTGYATFDPGGFVELWQEQCLNSAAVGRHHSGRLHQSLRDDAFVIWTDWASLLK